MLYIYVTLLALFQAMCWSVVGFSPFYNSFTFGVAVYFSLMTVVLIDYTFQFNKLIEDIRKND